MLTAIYDVGLARRQLEQIISKLRLRGDEQVNLTRDCLETHERCDERLLLGMSFRRQTRCTPCLDGVDLRCTRRPALGAEGTCKVQQS